MHFSQPLAFLSAKSTKNVFFNLFFFCTNDTETMMQIKVGLVMDVRAATVKRNGGRKARIIFVLTLFNDDVKSKGFP